MQIVTVECLVDTNLYPLAIKAGVKYQVRADKASLLTAMGFVKPVPTVKKISKGSA